MSPLLAESFLARVTPTPKKYFLRPTDARQLISNIAYNFLALTQLSEQLAQ